MRPSAAGLSPGLKTHPRHYFKTVLKTRIPDIKDVTTFLKYGRVILVKIPDKGDNIEDKATVQFMPEYCAWRGKVPEQTLRCILDGCEHYTYGGMEDG